MEINTQLDVADRLSPTLGWRAWDLRAGGLASPWTDHRWEAGVRMEAGCKVTATHVAPYSSCHCGIYAASTLMQVQGWVYQYQLSASGIEKDDYLLLGRVALWGRIEEHEYGFRAQYAYPYELYLPAQMDPSWGEDLAKRYGVRMLAHTPKVYPAASFVPKLKCSDEHVINLALNEVKTAWASPEMDSMLKYANDLAPGHFTECLLQTALQVSVAQLLSQAGETISVKDDAMLVAPEVLRLWPTLLRTFLEAQDDMPSEIKKATLPGLLNMLRRYWAFEINELVALPLAVERAALRLKLSGES